MTRVLDELLLVGGWNRDHETVDVGHALTPVGLTGRRTRLRAPRTSTTNGRKPIRHCLPSARARVLWRRWLARALPFDNIRSWRRAASGHLTWSGLESQPDANEVL